MQITVMWMIFVNAFHESWLITEMVSNDLPQALTKKLQGETYHFDLCIYKWIGVDSSKPSNDNFFLTLAYKSFCYVTWKLIQFSCLIKCLHQHKWWKLFQTSNHHNVLNHIIIVRAFSRFPTTGCSQNNGLFSSTGVLIT